MVSLSPKPIQLVIYYSATTLQYQWDVKRMRSRGGRWEREREKTIEWEKKGERVDEWFESEIKEARRWQNTWKFLTPNGNLNARWLGTMSTFLGDSTLIPDTWNVIHYDWFVTSHISVSVILELMSWNYRVSHTNRLNWEHFDVSCSGVVNQRRDELHTWLSIWFSVRGHSKRISPFALTHPSSPSRCLLHHHHKTHHRRINKANESSMDVQHNSVDSILNVSRRKQHFLLSSSSFSILVRSPENPQTHTHKIFEDTKTFQLLTFYASDSCIVYPFARLELGCICL